MNSGTAGETTDVVVVGSGPNGLAAAITLARAGLSVQVFEGAATVGGGCRTAELTLPGFHHDVCSAVHPLAVASPFFAGLDLDAGGVTLRTPEVAFAHPLDGGRAGALRGGVTATSAAFGDDAPKYRRLLGPLVDHIDEIIPTVLAPLRSFPAHPLPMARYGLRALPSVEHLAKRFETDEARGLLAGVGAHSMLPLDAPLTGGFALLLAALAHSVGWPVVEGGSARLVDLMVAEIEGSGGRIHSGHWISNLPELPTARATLFDITPRQLLKIGGSRLGPRYRRSLERFAYGPGIFKMDWALSGPVPWEADACRLAGTVHVGGSFDEVAAAEAAANAGTHPERPFCLISQPTVLDPARAPEGRHTLWGYCHVPSGSDVDMSSRIENQIERFAPGFRDLVLARATTTARETQQHNPNYVGGDINAGMGTLRQTIFRPTAKWNPYRIPIPGYYLCSASTPPGGGVHGMCGFNAAQTVLRDLKIAAPTH